MIELEDEDDDEMGFGELTHQEIVIKPKSWMKDVTMTRVDSIEMLKRVVDECIAAGHYGWDTETTGLDTRVFDGRTVERIVGHCLAPHEDIGYYVPIRHEEGTQHNLPITQVNQELIRLAESLAIAVFHGHKFDGEMLEFGESQPIGQWDDHKKFEETLLLAYLLNPRNKKFGLKGVTLELLGRDMIELKDLFHPDHPKGQLSFAKTDPSEDGPVWYGCSDAMCTLGNYKKLIVELNREVAGIKSQKGIYSIEKMCSVSVRWMQRARIPLCLKTVAELIRSGQDEMVKTFDHLYDEVEKVLGRDVRPAYVRYLSEHYHKDRDTVRITKTYLDSIRRLTKAKDPLEPDGKTIIKFMKDGKTYPMIYDVKSSAQLGPMLEELGIKDLPRTEKGAISTKGEVLDAIIDKYGDKFSYMKFMKKFREVNKALGDFLFPMEQDSDKRDDTLKISYKQPGTDTGRFSTPGEKRARGLHGGTTLNLQSLPSKDKKDKVECMVRIRECVISRPGKVIVAIDFAGVELRLVTCMSKEPIWIKAFFECSTCGQKYPNAAATEGPEKGLPPKTPAYCYKCGDDRIGDLHTISGMAFFGADAPKKPDWKEKRGLGKMTNFLLLYGGSGTAVSRVTKLGQNEGWRIYKTFNSTYKSIKRWQDGQVKFGQKYGFVRTPFGRRYPLPDIANEEKWIREKSMRNAINSPIQGASADVTKLTMGLCYKECKKRGWLEKVRMIITMHDELVFEIDEDILEEAIEVINYCMTSNPVLAGMKWPVCLTTDVEFGRNWTVPYDRKDWVFQREEALAKWPEWAINLFSEKSIDPVIIARRAKEGKGTYKFGGGASDPVSSEGKSAEAAKIEFKSPASQVSKIVSPKVDNSDLNIPAGDVLNYTLSRPLTFGAVEDLAQVISKTVNRGGTRKLRVELPDGGVLVSEEHGIVVNASKFLTYAEEHLEGS